MIPTTPADVEALLALLIPGFLAVKVFSVVGLRGRRTDLELTLWSLVAAAAINAALDAAAAYADLPAAGVGRLVLASYAGVIAGLVLGQAWTAVVGHWPALRARVTARAWDTVLLRPDRAPWVQVWTTSGKVVRGWPQRVAEASDTDALDLYLREPEWVGAESGRVVPMTGVDGVLIAETQIALVQVLDAPTVEAPQTSEASDRMG